jgi:hypothetical protein
MIKRPLRNRMAQRGTTEIQTTDLGVRGSTPLGRANFQRVRWPSILSIRPAWHMHFGGCRAFDAVATAIREGIKQPPAASRSPTLLSGRETVLEGPILGLPGLIEEKPAEQAGSGASGGTEPRVPADRASDGADAGACSGAGNRAAAGSASCRRKRRPAKRRPRAAVTCSWRSPERFDQRDCGQG